MVEVKWIGATLNFSGIMFKQNEILFIGPYSKKPKGGVAIVLREYSKIFPNSYFIASTVSKNIFTKISGFLKGVIHFIFLLITQPQIKIIHIHGASYSSFKRKYIYFKIAKLFNKKIIYHIHSGGFHIFYKEATRKIKNRIHFFIENADCIICLSKRWEKFYLENFTPKKIVIVPNIISEPKKGVQVKQMNDNTSFLFLGLIDRNKGVWLLLETLKQYKEELLNKAVFYIGGNGETKELKEKIVEYGLSDIVKYIGWVSGEEKQKLFLNADVYILPSYNEGLPISILEAMSYSLPILSTTVGGIPEIVSKENGRLIEPGNKDMLWEAISFFTNTDKSTLTKMGEASSAKVNPHLPEAVKNNLISLYINT